jgi:hypothetical protein
MRSGPGVTFGLGAVLAIAATGFHSAVIAPAARELAAIVARTDAAGGPPSSDLATVQRLQARLAWGARTWAVLLLLAAAAMSVARYVGKRQQRSSWPRGPCNYPAQLRSTVSIRTRGQARC